MEGILAALSRLPPWAGNIPVWSVLLIIVGTLIKIWPVLRQQTITERTQRSDTEIAERNKIAEHYRSQLKAMHENMEALKCKCDEQEIVQNKRIDALRQQLNNEMRQRVQSEISLVNTLIQVVDAPQLKAILKALEKRNVLLFTDADLKPIHGPFEDGAKRGEEGK